MESDNSYQLPIRAKPHVIEHASIIILQDRLPRHWIIRISGVDYGLDGEIEIVSKDGVVKGDIFKFQIKGHRKVHSKEQHIIQRVNVSTINYWSEVPLPVILFIVDIDRAIVYWVDVKSYIRNTLSVVRPNWHHQQTTHVKIPIENRLPESLQGIKELVLSYKERLKSYQIAFEKLEEGIVGADFIGYHILIHLYNGDIDAWERYLRQEGSECQLLDDYPFVVWLKEQLKRDKDLLDRIRRLVLDTTPKIFGSRLEGDPKIS